MSVHIEAEKGAIADTVLLPGDPLRAQWIANTFLEDVVCYNKVRGMLGFTGFYKGKRISVQASGMGVPSALIYYHELINDYEVKNLIRVGTAGSYQEHVKLKDIIIAMSASSTSAINTPKFGSYTYAPTASYNLFEKAVDYAKTNNLSFHAGNILTADVFYDDNPEFFKIWAEYGVLCVEMETAGLYSIAAKNNVNALTVLTISDSLVSKETTSAKERESTFDSMVDIALNIG